MTSICLTFLVVCFQKCLVNLQTLAGIGTDPAHDNVAVCCELSLFLCARSYLFREELAMTIYRVEKVNSGQVVQVGAEIVSGLCF